MSKVAVVTGAGGVLCSSFAKELAKNGYAVALLDLNEEAVKKVAEEIVAAGGKANSHGQYQTNCNQFFHKFLQIGSYLYCARSPCVDTDDFSLILFPVFLKK